MRVLAVAIGVFVALNAVAHFGEPGAYEADPARVASRMAIIAHQQPNFSVRQLQAVELARYRAAHPKLSELSPAKAVAHLSRLALTLLTTSAATTTTQSAALFTGNLTALQVQSSHSFQLER